MYKNRYICGIYLCILAYFYCLSWLNWWRWILFLGLGGAFLMYSGFCCLTLITAFFAMPETKVRVLLLCGCNSCSQILLHLMLRGWVWSRSRQNIEREPRGQGEYLCPQSDFVLRGSSLESEFRTKKRHLKLVKKNKNGLPRNPIILSVGFQFSYVFIWQYANISQAQYIV